MERYHFKIGERAYTIQNPKAYLMDGSVLTERHKSIDALKGERMSVIMY